MVERRRAVNICKRLQDAGFEAVFAGGCIRDMLLEIAPNDFDVATSATPEQVKRIFSNSKFVGENFGVSIVNGIEVATFRSDGDYLDGRRPDSVVFSSMEEDAKRRDLTINALFFDPITEEVIDFVGGKVDIEKGIIRFVGNAEDRINEDSLRILRAVRFAVRLDFNMENPTEAIIFENGSKVKSLSGERVFEELKKGLMLENPEKYILQLDNLGILNHILPEVADLVGSTQSKRWHNEGDVFTHSMLVLSKVKSEDYRIRMAALFHDIGKPYTRGLSSRGDISNHGHDKVGAFMFQEIAERLRISNEDSKLISYLIEDHMKALEISKMKKPTLRRFISKEHFEELMKLVEADILGSGFGPWDLSAIEFAREAVKKFSGEEKTPILPKPFIDGHTLIARGMKPSSKFKIILDKLMDMQLEGEVNSIEDALIELDKLTVKE
jgi:poly(A) polymerase